MKALFFIEIPTHYHTEESRYHWYKKDLAEERYGDDSLTAIQTLSQDCEVILVFSGFHVTEKHISSKIRNRKKLELAIGYELEEALPEELEELFFAYQPTKQKEVLQVAVVNRVWFEKWLDIFKQHAIALSAAVSDALLLQNLPQDYLLIKKADYFLLKTPESRFCIDNENIGFVLNKIAATLPTELPLITDQPQPFELSEIAVNLTATPTQDSLLKFLTAPYVFGTGLNLLQGAYQPTLKNDWQKIKLACIGLFSLLLLATLYQGYQHWQLTQQEAKLDQQRLAIFQKNFPAIKKIVNPLAQMKHQLEVLKQNQQQQGQFISLLAKVSNALRQMIQQGSITLTGIEFDNNLLIVKLNANSLALIEQIKQQLAAQQLQVEIESSDKVENQVNASFKISGVTE